MKRYVKGSSTIIYSSNKNRWSKKYKYSSSDENSYSIILKNLDRLAENPNYPWAEYDSESGEWKVKSKDCVLTIYNDPEPTSAMYIQKLCHAMDTFWATEV